MAPLGERLWCLSKVTRRPRPLVSKARVAQANSGQRRHVQLVSWRPLMIPAGRFVVVACAALTGSSSSFKGYSWSWPKAKLDRLHAHPQPSAEDHQDDWPPPRGQIGGRPEEALAKLLREAAGGGFAMFLDAKKARPKASVPLLLRALAKIWLGAANKWLL